MAPVKKRTKIYPSFIALDSTYYKDEENLLVDDHPSYIENVAKANTALLGESSSEEKQNPAEYSDKFFEIKLETKATVAVKSLKKDTTSIGNPSNMHGEKKHILRVKKLRLKRQDTHVLNLTSDAVVPENKPLSNKVRSPKPNPKRVGHVSLNCPKEKDLPNKLSLNNEIKIEKDNGIYSPRGARNKAIPKLEVSRKRKGLPDSSESTKQDTKQQRLSSPGSMVSRGKGLLSPGPILAQGKRSTSPGATKGMCLSSPKLTVAQVKRFSSPASLDTSRAIPLSSPVSRMASENVGLKQMTETNKTNLKRNTKEKGKALVLDEKNPKAGSQNELGRRKLTRKTSKEVNLKKDDVDAKANINLVKPAEIAMSTNMESKSSHDVPNPERMQEQGIKPQTRALRAKKSNYSPYFEVTANVDGGSVDKANTKSVASGIKKERAKRQLSNNKNPKGKEGNTKTTVSIKSEALNTARGMSPRQLVAVTTALKTEDRTTNRVRLPSATEQSNGVEKETRGARKQQLRKAVSLDNAADRLPEETASTQRKDPDISPILQKTLERNGGETKSPASRLEVADPKETEPKIAKVEDLGKTGAIPKRAKIPRTGVTVNKVNENAKVYEQSPARLNNTQPRKIFTPGRWQINGTPGSTRLGKQMETPKRLANLNYDESTLRLVLEALKETGGQKGCSVQGIKKFIRAKRGTELSNDTLKKVLEKGLLSKRLVRQGSVQTVSLVGSYKLPTEQASEMPESKPLVTDVLKQASTVDESKPAPQTSTKVGRKAIGKGKSALDTSAGNGVYRQIQKTPSVPGKAAVTRCTSTPLQSSESVLNTTFVLSPIKESKTDTEDTPKVAKRRRSRSESVFPVRPTKALSAAAAVRMKNARSRPK